MARSAPKHLQPATAAWWRGVLRDFDLDEHHVRLLTLAAESWDRAQEARERLVADGAYYVDRFHQPKSHPAIGVERDARLAFARLLRELDLDAEAPADVRTPRRGRG